MQASRTPFPPCPSTVPVPPQLPSNLVMVRVGVRAWLGFLLIAWGAVATSFMFVRSATSFYACRILLGLFEAGAFPAMWYALSTFYPRNRWAAGVGASIRRSSSTPGGRAPNQGGPRDDRGPARQSARAPPVLAWHPTAQSLRLLTPSHLHRRLPCPQDY